MIDYSYDGETVRLSARTSDLFVSDQSVREEVLVDAEIFADTHGKAVKVLSDLGIELASVEPVKVPS